LEDDHQDLDIADLRIWLKERLPAFMVPQIFMPIDHLPTTANGKLDRDALPQPDTHERQTTRDYVEPIGETQPKVAAVYADVLGLEQVGAADDFFELGGHSLLATRVLSRLRNLFQAELPLKLLFEEPSVAGLSRLIEQAAKAKEEAPIIPAQALPGGGYPLSFAQERMWFLYQYEGANPALNVSAATALRGKIDLEAAQLAVAQLFQQHKALRTVFRSLEGEPRQWVELVPAQPLAIYDLRHLEDQAREQEWQSIRQREAAFAFRLERGPLGRFTLVRMQDDLTMLLIITHHIISDGWSFSILLEDMINVYAAAQRDPQALAKQPKPELQYVDYAAWQREWFAEARLQQQLQYWQQKLANHDNGAELPADKPRQAERVFRPASLQVTSSPSLAKQIERLTKATQTTPFMVLLTGLKALVSRLTAANDISIGTPVAGRNRAQTEKLVGLFLNTLVLRDVFNEGESFASLLEKVKQTTLGAFDHQDIPFEKLIAELQPERDPSHNPFFQIFFNMLNLPETAQLGTDLVFETVDLPDVGAKFDLTLYASETPQGLHFHAVYDANLYSAQRMEMLLDQFLHLLQMALSQPQQKLAAISLRTETISQDLPDPGQPFSDHAFQSIPSGFSAMAETQTEAVAVRDAKGQLSYRELSEQVKGISQYLTQQGFQPGDVVAIWAHRERFLLPAVLGTLRAGGAFLILDPAYPAQRISEYLSLSSPAAWITTPEAEALPESLRAEVSTIGIQLDLPANLTVDQSALAATLNPAALAYLSFTSGSTGKPKAIEGCHGGLSHYIPWMNQRFQFSANDRFSMLSGLAHDPLQRDMFTPLLVGASLHIPSPETLVPDRLASWMAQQQITVAHLTPAMSRILTQAEGITLNHLRLVFLVGEALTRAEVNRLKALAPDVTVVNFYGSTESQRAVSYYPMAHALADDQPEIVPLGRGIADVQLLILNAENQLASVGEPGEILLRAPWFARGYRGGEEQDRARFCANPFSDDANERLYRTGDLGHYLPDGNVASLGRIDRQIKLRGFRIEPAEIESVLEQNGAVASAVVIRHQREENLIAYVVPRGSEIDLKSVQNWLREQLPAYMVPNYWQKLEQLPLTPNGKVNLQALPEPQLQQQSQVQPLTNATQHILAAIWSEVLEHTIEDANSSFFLLGGHSLKATTVVSRIRDAFQIELPLRLIFEDPTLAQLAEHIDQMRQESDAERLPLIAREHQPEAMPVSYAQQRLWFLDQLEGPSATYNMVSALRLTGNLNRDALHRTINTIVERHAILRMNYPAVEGKPAAILRSEPLQALEISQDLIGQPAAACQARIENEALKPFDLGKDPLLRLYLYPIAEEEHILLTVMHHIVADGWSVGVFVREFSTAYSAFCQGESQAQLPELAVSFADYAVWQRERMDRGLLAHQLQWWRNQLSGMQPLLDLPLDQPRPAQQAFRGATLEREISPTLTQSLKQLATTSNTTLYMVLLTGFSAVLQRLCDTQEVCVGTPISNRTRSEIEHLIGFFANTLALRIDLSGDDLSFAQLLQRVRTTTLDAYAHQDVPFDAVVDEVKPVRDPSYHPLFQVMCILQNAADDQLQLPELTLEAMPIGDDTAKFDLVFNMREGQDRILNSISYNCDILSEVTVELIATSFTQLLEQASRHPETPIDDLPQGHAPAAEYGDLVVLDPQRRIVSRHMRGTLYRKAADGTLEPTGESGYVRADGELVRYPSMVGYVSYQDLLVNTEAIASNLRQLPQVSDAYVLARTHTDTTHLIAYIVPNGPFLPDVIRADLAQEFETQIIPEIMLPISRLPLQRNGAIAVQQLLQLPVVEPAVAEQWQEQLRSTPGVQAAAALIVERQPEAEPSLHLDDLLPPAYRHLVRDQSQESADPAIAPSAELAAIPAEVDGGEVITPVVETLTQLLRRTAKNHPDNGIGFLPSNDFISYADLLTQAQIIAANLRAAHEQPGQPVLFQLEDPREFICTFWGCVWAGMIPVPVAIAPSYSQTNGGINKLYHAWQMLGEPPIIASEKLVEPIAQLHKVLNFKGFTVIAYQDLKEGVPQEHPAVVDPEQPALMLLTSGSTGKPKAVQQTAKALLHRSAAVAHVNDFSPADRCFNWMPLDHVGGIVMFHLRDLYVGASQYHATTQTILEDPLLWLDLMHQHRITATWAPNFAYGLINDALEAQQPREWDLSQLRFILNGGEAVVAKTALRFLVNLAPFGLPQTAMKPAWGMSETCSGVVYHHDFSPLTAQESDEAVVVGKPVPGFAVRIAKQDGSICGEGETGHLLVRGPSVTMGYFGTVNAEAFSEDGWFDTGDLGILKDGALTIAGRAKEDIIINGINYAASEIEALVEEDPEVSVSFTAACAVRPEGSQTDQLAVFFHTSQSKDAWVELIPRLHERIVQGVGLAPDFLIPVEREEIPKTGIGKIQRGLLKSAFQKGQFDTERKQIDLLLANRNTMRNWFFKRSWIPAKPRPLSQAEKTQQILILADRAGVGAALQTELLSAGCEVVLRYYGPGENGIDPAQLDAFKDLFKQTGVPDTVYLMWPCDATDETAADRVSLLATLHLLQAAETFHPQQLQLIAVSHNAQYTGIEPQVQYASAAIGGFLKTIALELDWAKVRHIDLDQLEPETTGQLLAKESHSDESEICYRAGQRQIPVLEQPSLPAATHAPINQGGLYLISGGLGGLGRHLAQELIERYDARVLLIGRRDLNQPEHQSSRDSYLALEQATHKGDGARLLYQAADVTDLAALRAATREAERQFGQSLAGIFHLAGAGNLSYHWTVADQHRILNENPTTFEMMTQPKIEGARQLYELIAHQPQALFVGFSSINAIFGGATFCAYSAANSGLEALIAAKRLSSHPNSYCLTWSMWDDVGMSADNPAQATAAARAMGYRIIDQTNGMHALFAMLSRQPDTVIVGLDGQNGHIASLSNQPVQLQQRLVGFVQGEHGSIHGDQGVRDRFDNTIPYNLHHLSAMPRDAAGRVDMRALRDLARDSGDQKQHIPPRSAVEYRVADIWKSVLGVTDPSIHDNFFQVGGHSLLATQLISRLRDAFALHLPVSVLFESPTIAQIAEHIEVETEPAETTSPIKPISRQQALPLSYAQQRLWLLDQIQGGSPAYNIRFALQLSGELHLDALKAALNDMIARHEVLRTRFSQHQGQPIQIIEPQADIAFVHESLKDQSHEARIARCDQEAALPFDLERGPLLRAHLFDIDSNQWLLQITVHHIIADGWSVGIFINEWSRCYHARLQNQQPNLPTLDIQYADFANWQRDQLQGEPLEKLLTFWCDHLADAPNLLELPLDRPRPAKASGKGQSCHFELGFETSERLKRLAKSQGASPTMVFHAALGQLLSRYSGQDRVVIGMPIANRNHTQIEPLIGFFVNTLALKSDQTGDPTFNQLLDRTKAKLLAAYEHQDLPFEMLVEELQPDRSLSHTPLFQVMLSVQNMDAGTLELPQLEASLLETASQTTRFDLTLTVAEGSDGFGAALTYNTDVFESDTAERMARQFQTLLERMLLQPETKVADIDLRTQAENDLLASWNQTQATLPTDSIWQQFAKQAELHGEKPALKGSAQLTFAELLQQTNQLAAELQNKNLRPGERVAVCLPKGAQLLSSVLAIWQRQATYVPIDPMLPSDRQQFILADSGAALIIRETGIEQLETKATDLPQQDAAYIIYTSGSTGTPKGVAVGEAALRNHLAWFNRDLLQNQAIDMPWISSIAFDASLKQMFAPLLRGDAVYLPPAQVLSDPDAFRASLVDSTQLAINCVPSLWETLLSAWESDGPHPQTSLQSLLLGGEAISPTLLERTWKIFPGLRIINLYGPTEACVNATWTELERDDAITIGRPCANTRIFLCDGQGRPVPLGARGEICIAGDSLAIGYHGLPELTAERFVDGSACGESRLYRSGDLGRFCNDGRLMYLGRQDDQVKVRGFRIELGEVETALAQQADVEQAVVSLQGKGSNAYLTGYVRWRSQAEANPQELMRRLQQSLPDYMVPSVIVSVDRFELTATGKIDRNALPKGTQAKIVAPRNEVESEVAAIWSDVLQLEALGVYDNFFERGGHSLTAVQVLTRLRSRFAVELSLRFLFEEPQVAAQAEALIGISTVAQELLGDSDEEEEEFAF
jgi:amino acid adenylation domain-containing protein